MKSFKFSAKQLDDAKRMLDLYGIYYVGMSGTQIVNEAGIIAEQDRAEMAALYAEKSRETSLEIR